MTPIVDSSLVIILFLRLEALDYNRYIRNVSRGLTLRTECPSKCKSPPLSLFPWKVSLENAGDKVLHKKWRFD